MTLLYLSIVFLYLFLFVICLCLIKIFHYIKVEQPVNQMKKDIAPPPDIGLEIGSLLLLHSFDTFDHGAITFDDHRSRLFAFSMVGCKSCEDTYHSLQKFTEHNPDIQIVLLLFSLEQEAAASTVQERKLTQFPVVWLQEQMLDVFQVKNFPFAYFLSSDNVLLNKRIINNYEHLQELVHEHGARPLNRSA